MEENSECGWWLPACWGSLALSPVSSKKYLPALLTLRLLPSPSSALLFLLRFVIEPTYPLYPRHLLAASNSSISGPSSPAAL